MMSAPVSAEFRRLSRLTALMLGLAAFSWTAGAQSATEARGSEAEAGAVSATHPNSEQLEKALQGLSWEQFRTVVEAIPKLKADVDAYGPLGWQYVQANYRTYPWRKNISKLQDPQKQRLSELIDEVRSGGKPSN